MTGLKLTQAVAVYPSPIYDADAYPTFAIKYWYSYISKSLLAN